MHLPVRRGCFPVNFLLFSLASSFSSSLLLSKSITTTSFFFFFSPSSSSSSSSSLLIKSIATISLSKSKPNFLLNSMVSFIRFSAALLAASRGSTFGFTAPPPPNFTPPTGIIFLCCSNLFNAAFRALSLGFVPSFCLSQTPPKPLVPTFPADFASNPSPVPPLPSFFNCSYSSFNSSNSFQNTSS